MDTGAVSHRLVKSLDEVRRTPLNQISDDQATDIVRRIIGRDASQTTVDVARFTSAI